MKLTQILKCLNILNKDSCFHWGCEAKILICMKEIRQIKIGIIINSRKNEKYKKENAIIDNYMPQFNGKHINLYIDY